MGLLIATLSSLTQTPIFAASGINEQINFQGRLYNNQGAVVNDGYYNIQFKIYRDGNGQSVGNTTGSPAGALLWTENHLNVASNGVVVRNGYFSVQLGSITTFGGSVDWSQDTLWLSINIGNTNTTCSSFSLCSPDGEMTPMKRLSSSPYALNAGRLGGLTSNQFLQVATGTAQTDTTTNTSIFLNKTSTGNFLDFQNAGASTFSITNTGNILFGAGSDKTISVSNSPANTAGRAITLTAGAAGTGATALSGGNLSLSAGSGGGTNGVGGNIAINAGAGSGTGAAGNISIGTTNATSIILGKTTGSTGITLDAGTDGINLGTNTASSVIIGTNTGSLAVNIRGTGGITLGNTSTSTTPISLYGTTLMRTVGTNSTTALQVQNASSKNVLTVDTTNGQVQLGASGSGGVNGMLVLRNSTGSNTVGLGLSGNPSASYTLYLPTTAPGGGQCLKAGTSNTSQMTFGNCIEPTTPQFVKQVTNNNASSSTTLATTIAATTAGNLLVAQIAVGSNTASVSSVTDNASNTWTKAVSSVNTGSSLDSEIWYAQNTSSTTSITVTTSSSQRIAVNISEFAGMATSSALDVTAGSTGAGTAFSSPTLTTTGAFELVFANLVWASGPGMTGSSSGGWNDLSVATNPATISSRYNIGNAAGPYSTSWTPTYYTNGSMTMAAFKSKGSGSDYAEYYGTTDASIEAGDIIASDPSRPAERITDSTGQDNSKAWIIKASLSNKKNVLGVVSSNPGQTIGNVYKGSDNPRPVALSGRVPVKVSSENGAIAAGDYLVPSSVPGVAMKATSPGVSIGTALSPYDNPDTSIVGTVTLFVNTTYYPGDDAVMLESSTPDTVSMGETGASQDNTSQGVSLEGDVSISGLTIAIDGNFHLFRSDSSSKRIQIGTGIATMSSSGYGDLIVGGNIEIKRALLVGDAANGFNITAGVAPSSTSGLYIGANRPIRTIAQVPAYTGLVSETSPSGSMNTGFDTNGFHNYYEWSVSGVSNETSTLVVRIPVPRDFSSLPQDSVVCFNTWKSSGGSSITGEFFDTQGTSSSSQSISPLQNNTWEKRCIQASGTIVVDGSTYLTVKIMLTSSLGSRIRVGEFWIDYLAAF